MLLGIGPDQAGIDSKTFATDQPLVDAALNNALKDTAKEIALTKSTMTVLREGGLIGNLAARIQPTEPAKRQVQMNVLAQSTFGSDAIAIADEQHADHQLRIHGRPADLTVEGLQILTDALEIDKDIDLALQMVGRNMVVETKIVK